MKILGHLVFIVQRLKAFIVRLGGSQIDSDKCPRKRLLSVDLLGVFLAFSNPKTVEFHTVLLQL